MRSPRWSYPALPTKTVRPPGTLAGSPIPASECWQSVRSTRGRELRQPFQIGVEFPVGPAALPARIKTILAGETAAVAHIAVIGIIRFGLIILHDDPAAAIAL